MAHALTKCWQPVANHSLITSIAERSIICAQAASHRRPLLGQLLRALHQCMHLGVDCVMQLLEPLCQLVNIGLQINSSTLSRRTLCHTVCRYDIELQNLHVHKQESPDQPCLASGNWTMQTACMMPTCMSEETQGRQADAVKS